MANFWVNDPSTFRSDRLLSDSASPFPQESLSICRGVRSPEAPAQVGRCPITEPCSGGHSEDQVGDADGTGTASGVQCKEGGNGAGNSPALLD